VGGEWAVVKIGEWEISEKGEKGLGGRQGRAGHLVQSHPQGIQQDKLNLIHLSSATGSFGLYLFILAVLEFELRALHLLGRCSAT
jgi:hypothetical protein